MTPTLTAYTDGMVVHWKQTSMATPGNGSSTLNIDGLGAKAVKWTRATVADTDTGSGGTCVPWQNTEHRLVYQSSPDAFVMADCTSFGQGNLGAAVRTEDVPLNTHNLCGLSGSSPTFTCTMNAISSVSAGMSIYLYAGTAITAAATFNVSSSGAVDVVQPDGTSNPSSACPVPASTPTLVVLDGNSHWRMVSCLAAASGTASVANIADIKVTKTSSTVLTLAAGTIFCGDQPYSISSTTFTLSSGSATSYIGYNCANPGTSTSIILARGANTMTSPSGYYDSSETNLDAYPQVRKLAVSTASSGSWGTVSDYRVIGTSEPCLVASTGIVVDRDANGNCRAARDSTTLSTGSTMVLHTKIWGTGTSSVLQDADDEASIWNNQTGGQVTIASVTCESDTGTPTVQLQRDDGSPTNMLSSNLSCATTPASTTTFVSGENVIASGNRVDYLTVSAGGSAHWVAITITYTRQ